MVVKVFIFQGLMVILGLFFCLCNALVVKLEKLRSIVRKQGISGPPLSFLLGNIREIKKSLSVVVKESSTDTYNCVTIAFPFFE